MYDNLRPILGPRVNLQRSGKVRHRGILPNQFSSQFYATNCARNLSNASCGIQALSVNRERTSRENIQRDAISLGDRWNLGTDRTCVRVSTFCLESESRSGLCSGLGDACMVQRVCSLVLRPAASERIHVRSAVRHMLLPSEF